MWNSVVSKRTTRELQDPPRFTKIHQDSPRSIKIQDPRQKKKILSLALRINTHLEPKMSEIKEKIPLTSQDSIDINSSKI